MTPKKSKGKFTKKATTGMISVSRNILRVLLARDAVVDNRIAELLSGQGSSNDASNSQRRRFAFNERQSNVRRIQTRATIRQSEATEQNNNQVNPTQAVIDKDLIVLLSLCSFEHNSNKNIKFNQPVPNCDVGVEQRNVQVQTIVPAQQQSVSELTVSLERFNIASLQQSQPQSNITETSVRVNDNVDNEIVQPTVAQILSSDDNHIRMPVVPIQLGAPCSDNDEENIAPQIVPLPVPQARRNHAPVRRSRQYKLGIVQGQNIGAENVVVVHHIGNLSDACPTCGALFYQREHKLSRMTRTGMVAFNNCCFYGNISPPPLLGSPPEFEHLWCDDGPRLTIFREQIRRVNSVFAMASFKTPATVPQPRVEGQGAWHFAIHGQIYHHTADLPIQTPEPNEPVRYNQYYFLDAQEAVERRVDFLEEIPRGILNMVEITLRRENPYIAAFATMKEKIDELKQANVPLENLVLAFKDDLNRELQNLDLEQSRSEIAAVFQGEPPIDVTLKIYPRRPDVQHQNEIKNLNKLADPFVYPLLFPRGEMGLAVGELRHNFEDKRVTFYEYYRFRMQIRNGPGTFDLLHSSGKLFQQYLVDAYVKEETNRLWWFRNHPRIYRSATYLALSAHLRNQAAELNAQVGKITILPASFGAGDRHKSRLYLDAMTIVSRHGKPDLFVTMTCNPNWPEIKDNLTHHQKWQHRPDLVCRVFNQKLMELLDDFVKKQLFGIVLNYHYAIEFQKRGLPHAHIIFTFVAEDKIDSPEKVDSYISASIPDRNQEPILYGVVAENYIHRKCGVNHPEAKCMKDGQCSKYYPKSFRDNTVMNFRDFYASPEYKRPRDNHVIHRQNEVYDNSWIVPYNRYLALKYRCHINLEVCGSLYCLKYLFKYIFKNDENIDFKIVSNNNGNRVIIYDEITEFVNARWLGSMEASWRILGYHMNGRSHSVNCLPLHLPGEHNILFDPSAPDDVIENNLNTPSRLMAYFALNRNDPNARNYKYVEIPEHYTWDDKNGQWNPRRQISKMFGNLWEVSPRNVQLFHMRILLQHVRGAQSFEDLRTVRGEVCSDFVVACERLNLLDNAQCYQAALREAALRDAPKRFRRFFAVICLTAAERLGNTMMDLWTEFKDPHCINDLILMGYTRPVALRLALQRIESIMRALRDDVDLIVFAFFNDPEASSLEEAQAAIPEPINQFMRGIDDELDEQQLNRQRHETFTVASLTDHQRSVYNEVIFCILAITGRLDDQQLITTLNFDIDYVNSRSGTINAPNLNLLFLDGPGGTGKTFLYNVILWHCRKANLSTIPVAFTGIAASLLIGGKTSHRGFKMPIFFDKTTKVGWPVEHDMSNELRKAHLIIWDEASMVSSNIVSAVDRYFRDLMGIYDKAFGGKLFLFGGDFRQTLPIIIRGYEHEIVANCLKRSDLWPCMRKVSLRENLRVRCAAKEYANVRNIDEHLVQIDFERFTEFILAMGEGRIKNFSTRTVGAPVDLIEITSEYLVWSKQALLNWLFSTDKTFNFADRAILTPTNNVVDEINEYVLSNMIPGRARTYFAVDVHEYDDQNDFHIPLDVINALGGGSLPPHNLKLKIGAVVMLLLNLDVEMQQCNGTRLIVKEMKDDLLILESLTGGANRGRIVYVPRFELVREFPHIPGKVRRLQFPVKLAFAITINKSQGQTFQKVGVYLERPCFSHGQLYVAFSRVGSPHDIKLYIANSSVQGQFSIRKTGSSTTRNVVFKDVFRDLVETNVVPIFPMPRQPQFVRRLDRQIAPPTLANANIVIDTDTEMRDAFDEYFENDDNFDDFMLQVGLNLSRNQLNIPIYTDSQLRCRVAEGNRPGTSGLCLPEAKRRRLISSSSESD